VKARTAVLHVGGEPENAVVGGPVAIVIHAIARLGARNRWVKWVAIRPATLDAANAVPIEIIVPLVAASTVPTAK
jgi:hypothetical protein